MASVRLPRSAGSAFVLLLALAALSCQGPAGPDGTDVAREDVVSPEVRLAAPEANARIVTDTLTLRATFPGGANDVARLEFFVNGTSDLGYDSAVVQPPESTFFLDLSAAGIEYGSVLVGAEATDSAGNIGQSGLRFFSYLAPGLPYRIEPWRVQGTTINLRIPAATTFVRTEEPTTLDVYSMAFRFSVPFDAALDSIEVNLTQASSPLLLGSLYLTLHPVVADSPGVAIDTFFFQPTDADLNRPLRLDLSSWRGDTAAWVLSDDIFLALGAPDSLGQNPSGIDLQLTSRSPEYVQPDYGQLWVGSRDASGVEHWRRGIALDSTLYLYPQISVILDQVDQP